MAHEQPKYREISSEELAGILEEHKKWLKTERREGKRARLFRANLEGAMLEEADLREANLDEANLEGAYLQLADLQRAHLRHANFQGTILYNAKLDKARLSEANLTEANLFDSSLVGAKLTNANLREAELGGADIRDADLSNADLTDAKSLLAGQLAGTILTNAKLPGKIARFERLDHAAETSKNARKVFVGLLAACAYSWLTIATTTDAQLLPSSATTPLPIIQTKIPIAGFYWAAPAILLAVYFYLHLYLRCLWSALADLPAFFQDGTALDEKAYPWLLNGLVRGHVRRLKKDRPALSRLENTVSILLAWWVVPLTLLGFWIRYLPRHEWIGTGLQIAAIVAATAFGVLSYGLARRTLRGFPTRFHWRTPWRDFRTYFGAAAVALVAALNTVSDGAINGVPLENDEQASFGIRIRILMPGVSLENDEQAPAGIRTWLPHLFSRAGYSTFATLREAEVSTRRDTWRGREEDIPPVNAANLQGADLRYADARGAFLVRADLRRADLKGANLYRADLQGADLSQANLLGALLWLANLQGAVLEGANLQGDNLWGANLQGAVLEDANLQGADLLQANLQGAVLTDADLQGVVLTRAGLQGAVLEDANLQGAHLWRANLQGAVLKDANLQGANLLQANLQGADLFQANLQGANLYRADLQGADFRGAKLQGADVSSADLTDAKNLDQNQLDAACYRTGREPPSLPARYNPPPASEDCPNAPDDAG